MDTNDYYALIGPCIVLRMVFEAWSSRRRGKRAHHLPDTLANLATGMGQVLFGVFTGAFLLLLYNRFQALFCLVTWRKDSAVPWILAFVGVDFCYYWFHRSSHAVAALWAVHAVHHQSSEMNLSVALRQTYFSDFSAVFFYWPLPLLGVPRESFFAAVGVLSLYQALMHNGALMSPGVFRDPFGPHLPGVEAIPINDIATLEKALASSDVAAVVVEPIQLEGGVRLLSPEYIEALCTLTEKHGALLVADEVQTGLGRTGQFLASDTWPRRPDAVLLAKHLGGGLVPISTMLTRTDLWERAYGADFETSEAHNCTFSGSALVCAAALAALDLLTDDVMVRVRDEGAAFRSLLRDKLEGLPGFVEVRGAGFVVGIELSPAKNPWLNFEHFGMEQLAHHPTSGLLLCHRLYKRGYFCFVCGHDWSTLRLQPRFNIPWDSLETFAATVREELVSLGELD